jgi:hypothetical protein
MQNVVAPILTYFLNREPFVGTPDAVVAQEIDGQRLVLRRAHVQVGLVDALGPML